MLNWLQKWSNEIRQSLRWKWTSRHHLIQTRLPRKACLAPHADVFWIFPGRETAMFLGNLSHGCISLTVVKGFFNVQEKPHLFPFVPLACCPATGHHWKERNSAFLASPLWVFINIYKIPAELFLIQASQPQLSQPFFTLEILQLLNILCGPLLSLSSTSMCLLCLFWWGENCTQHSRWGLE